MPFFFMAVGLAGSGKSYLYKSEIKRIEPNCVHISSDAIREEVFGDVNDQSHNMEVFEIMKRRTIDALLAGFSVYYDATNLSAKRRIGFLKNIEHIKGLVKVCVLNVPPFEVVKARNAGRDRVVPEEVINSMLKRFEIPHESEGWDRILLYGNDMDMNALNDIVLNAKELSHDNPHHSASVGNHMLLAQKYVVDNSYADIRVIEAALFHDCGKPFCKVFKNARGEESDVAHYYNHENIGAYFYISHSDKSAPRAVYIANLIQHHMDYFKGEKYLQKISDRFGEYFMRDLDVLHEGDINAH